MLFGNQGEHLVPCKITATSRPPESALKVPVEGVLPSTLVCTSQELCSISDYFDPGLFLVCPFSLNDSVVYDIKCLLGTKILVPYKIIFGWKSEKPTRGSGI